MYNVNYIPLLKQAFAHKYCQAMPWMSFKGRFNAFRTVPAKLVKGLRTTVKKKKKKADQTKNVKVWKGFLQGKLLSGSACDVVISKSKLVP